MIPSTLTLTERTMALPNPGDVYVLEFPIRTLAGVTYAKGDELKLVSMTEEAPFGFKSGLSNWIIECRHFKVGADESIWSNIWQMIDTGLLTKKES